MIDYFNSIFTAVAKELRKQVPGIFVTGEINDSNVKKISVCADRRKTAIFLYILILLVTASTLPFPCVFGSTPIRTPDALQKHVPLLESWILFLNRFKFYRKSFGPVEWAV